MTNLNEVYKQKQLFYYCNTCGDINIPNTDPLSIHQSDELPLREQNLYENYWGEGFGCHMYVVKYRNNTGMILGFLFDESYLCDLLNKNEVSDEDMSRFYTAISDYANLLEQSNKIAGCEVLIGNNTDPDGHELLVFVPYEKRNEIKEIAALLDNEVYNSVKKLL